MSPVPMRTHEQSRSVPSNSLMARWPAHPQPTAVQASTPRPLTVQLAVGASASPHINTVARVSPPTLTPTQHFLRSPGDIRRKFMVASPGGKPLTIVTVCCPCCGTGAATKVPPGPGATLKCADIACGGGCAEVPPVAAEVGCEVQLQTPLAPSLGCVAFPTRLPRSHRGHCQHAVAGAVRWVVADEEMQLNATECN